MADALIIQVEEETNRSPKNPEATMVGRRFKVVREETRVEGSSPTTIEKSYYLQKSLEGADREDPDAVLFVDADAAGDAAAALADFAQYGGMA